MTITRRAQRLSQGFLAGPTVLAFTTLIWRPAGPMQWVCEMLSRAYLSTGGRMAAALGRRWRGRGR